MRRASRGLAFGLVLVLAGAREARGDDPKPAPPPAEGPKDAPPDAPRERAGLPVGSEAPAIEVAGWVNVPDGKQPTAETLKGKAIFLEFWATTCGPCVRTLPKVQAIHDRYAPRGLVVLGISPDAAFQQTKFAGERGLTFPLGVDSGDALRAAFRVDGIPATYLIGPDGKVAAHTTPMHADDAIDRLLGYRTGATGPLDDYLASLSPKDPPSTKFHLERLAGRGATTVDLAAWAKAAGGAPAPEGKPAPKTDGTRALQDLAKANAAKDAAKSKAALDALAAGGPNAFDLSQWAADALARDFPVTAKELEDLAKAKRYDALVDAILDRKPPAGALDAVAKLEAVQEHASKAAARERRLARKGLMILGWPLAGKPPKDEEANQKFWRDLSSTGWVEDADKKPIAMDVEGTMIFKDSGPAQVERWLSRAFVMDALTAGKKPDLAKRKAEVAKSKSAIEKELRATYGE